MACHSTEMRFPYRSQCVSPSLSISCLCFFVFVSVSLCLSVRPSWDFDSMGAEERALL